MYFLNNSTDKENMSNPSSYQNKSVNCFNSNKFNSTYSKSTMNTLVQERDGKMEGIENYNKESGRSFVKDRGGDSFRNLD